MAAVLLDTNVLIRLIGEPDRLPRPVRDHLADPGTDLVLSAASAWEVATKTRSGRLPGGELLVSTWGETLARLRIAQLPIEPEDALLAGGLEWDHRDPFDRVIVAQAQRRALTVATSDRVLLGAGRVRVLDARG
ncbi:MAG TPA: type II toxin-antitoxin system VapC family toxin [Actinomycetales bacterium]|nr:type II toxin-antitoxin system VapC family toxin [Actinomycetales bacterium]